MLGRLGVAMLVVLGAGGCVRRMAQGAEEPVVIYTAARVLTLVPGAVPAQAVAVAGGKVLAVGSLARVRQAVGAGAREVALGDVTVVPGLEDAHGHLASLGESLVTVSLVGARSLEEAVARMAAAGPRSAQGDWLVGRGWDQNGWLDTGGGFPTRAALDGRWPSRPVALERVDGHALWVNGEALRRAHLTAKTKDPAGGRILRDARGEPTGVLVDNAMELVRGAMPQPTRAQEEERLRAALARCAQAGLTAVHDAGMNLSTFRVLQDWDRAGTLPLRVYAMAYGQGHDVEAFLAQGPLEGRHLELRAVKFFMDGALGSRGAALFQPYSDEPSQRGLLLLTEAELEARARRFMARGFQVAVHAIGDRANHLVLDVLERAQRDFPTPGRNRVEHAQVLAPADLPRFAALGVVASMQPTHATSDMAWVARRLGPERLKGAYAWHSLLASGAHVAFGSDFPVEAPDVLPGLYAARTRMDAHGRPAGGWHPEERVDGEAALRGFTTGAAYASFGEGRRGRLAPGMDADFTVLSVDPVTAPPDALLRGRVVATVVDGEVTYGAVAPSEGAAR